MLTFHTDTDMAWQLLLDGCEITKKQNHHKTAVILVFLSLPPAERYKDCNIKTVTLIPGPKDCKDLDSFLFPFVEEMKLLHDGILGVRNSFTNTTFTLRAHTVLVSGDGLASADAMGLKRPGNSYRPCHHCMITRVQGPGGTYYIPRTDVDMESLPPRDNLLEIIRLFGQIDDPVVREDKSKDIGISRVSCLCELVSLRWPQSFPIDIMHAFLQNVCPMCYTKCGGRNSSDDQKAVVAQRKYRQQQCVDWIKSYEELYYAGNASRLNACRINVHSVLHLGTIPLQNKLC